MTAVEQFVEALQRRGVEWMATLCGHGLDPLFHAAKAAGLRLVDTRNEQTAGYIADYFGRLTRRPGVCAVSSAVAHANALTGVVNAWFDGSPMLLISGAAAVRTAGMGHFQDMDQVAMARPVTKYARVIDHPDRAAQIVEEALDVAMVEPQGPVHLTFPMDIQRAEADHPVVRTPIAAPVFHEDMDAAAEAIAAAERPLVVAGSGVWYANEGAALIACCERLRIPFVVPIWDRGVVEKPSPAFAGIQGALSGAPGFFERADCVVMAGAISDYRVGYLQHGARVVRLTRGWAELDRRLTPTPAHAAWLEEVLIRRDEFRHSVEEKARQQGAGGTHALDILNALRRVLSDDALLLIDGGSVGQWAHHLLTDRYPSHWLTCGRSGVVGWGLAGAMAARLARPESPVVLLAGDGAFTFNVAELECAARQGLHFVAIVADDLGWGITRTGHIRQFGEPISSSLGPVKFDQLAESLGARGAVAASREEIEPKLRWALEQKAVTVLHVPIVGGNP